MKLQDEDKCIVCNKRRIVHAKEIQKALESDEWKYIQYAIDFEKSFRNLETNLDNVEDPELIIKDALIAGVEFYDGDWCGVIESDSGMKTWRLLCWYDQKTGEMNSLNFYKFEELEHLRQWEKALYNCESIYISDTSIYKDISPKEYEIYKYLNAQSILAIPIGKTPTGFLIVRNPKRHMEQRSYLQTLGYVVFSALKESKLLDEDNKVFSPENIKNDKDVMINLFGKLEIRTSKGVLREEELNAPKLCRVLTYLLLYKKQFQSSRAVYEAIWLDEIDNAAANMKSLIFRFQKTFSTISDYRLIVSTPYGYRVNPELNIMIDIEKFDELRFLAQSVLSTKTKIELLKRIMDLYKGGLFTSASGEHWLLASEVEYKYKYIGVVNELLKTLYESQNYLSIQLYASKTLTLEKYNSDAYFWMIRAMRKLGFSEMAKSELKIAEQLLMEEEYEDLLERLERCK